VYLSPWDRHEPKYEDSAAYDEYFKAQLTELLTNYGPVAEVWFDGAGSEGHVYDFPGFYSLIRRLQPNAVIAICGPDVRWVGNEDGVARETEWSVQPANPTFHGKENENVWYPAECDTSIRPGWFWHPEQDTQVKSLDRLMDIYYKSVGRNSALLLNVPPNSDGLIAEPDLERLREFRSAIDAIFAVDFALGKEAKASNIRGKDPRFGPARALDLDAETYWATDDEIREAWIEVDLKSPTTFNVARMEEMISLGQRVEAYKLEAWVDGAWKTVSEGTTIGRKKLDRFEKVTTNKVRLTIEKARACPTIRSFGLHFDPR
jgi:alpha-L-fucosidase